MLLAALLLAACGNPAGSGGPSEGSAQFVIDIDPTQPLDVTLAMQPESPLAPGQELTVFSTVTGADSADCTYRWYLEGELLAGENESDVTLGSEGDELEPSRYRVTLIVSCETRAGSAGAVFDVVP